MTVGKATASNVITDTYPKSTDQPEMNAIPGEKAF